VIGRIASASALGFLVTIALFWFMQAILQTEGMRRPSSPPYRIVDFIRLKPVEETEPERRRVFSPPEPIRTPLPLLASSMAPSPPPSQTASPVNLDISSLPLPTANLGSIPVPSLAQEFQAATGTGPGSNVGGHGSDFGGMANNADVVPLVRVPPRYPMDAAARHIEGWVRVEFTIDEQGGVEDIRVVESSPPRIFDQAATHAIARWEFKPRIVDGKAVKQRAVQVLEFRLNK
jgi:protein TonB